MCKIDINFTGEIMEACPTNCVGGPGSGFGKAFVARVAVDCVLALDGDRERYATFGMFVGEGSEADVNLKVDTVGEAVVFEDATAAEAGVADEAGDTALEADSFGAFVFTHS